MNRSVHYLRAFLFFFNATGTLIVSFLPIYFRNNGLTGSQIGLLLAIGPLASMIAQPFWGYMSDKYHTVKKILFICLLGLLIASLFLFNQTDFLPFLLITPLFFSLMGPVGALGDSLASKTSQVSQIPFGSIRMWGSIGFATTSLIAGFYFTKFGIDTFIYIYLFYIVLTLLSCLKISDVTISTKPVTRADTKKVFKNRQLILFFLMIMLLTIGHRTNDSFIGLYVEELGGKESLIGWIWFVGVLAEAVMFALAHKWFKKYSEIVFIIMAGMIYTIRWFIYAMISDPIFIVPLQIMHGLTFPVFYIAAFSYVTKLVPPELQGTGHLLLISVFFGLSGIIGSILGGLMMEIASGSALYQVMGFISLLGTITLIMYHYGERKKRFRPVVS